jgi:hypothetical protein
MARNEIYERLIQAGAPKQIASRSSNALFNWYGVETAEALEALPRSSVWTGEGGPYKAKNPDVGVPNLGGRCASWLEEVFPCPATEMPHSRFDVAQTMETIERLLVSAA